MYLVPRPEHNPGQCAITARSEDPGGFLDTGNNLPFWSPRVYISAVGAQIIAEKFGYVSKPLHDEALDLIGELQAQLEQVKADLNDRETELDAVYSLRQRGWVDGKKTGRPPKETVNG